MSMSMAIVQGKTAYLYTDTLYVDPVSGEVLAFGHKMIAGSRFPWVVGFTLLYPPHPEWQVFDRDPGDIPELLEQLAQAVGAFSSGRMAPVRLLAAAWDEKWNMPRIFVAGANVGAQGHSPHCPAGVGEVRYFVGVDDLLFPQVALIWQGQTPNDPKYFHPEFDAPSAFEVQRSSPRRGGCVGGSLEMSRVTRDGVSGTIIYEWPDKLGKPVGPMIAAYPACELSPLR